MIVVMVMGMPRAAAIMSAHVFVCMEASSKTKTKKKKKVRNGRSICVCLYVPRCKGSKQVGRMCRRLCFFIPFHNGIGLRWVIIMSRTNESDARCELPRYLSIGSGDYGRDMGWCACGCLVIH